MLKDKPLREWQCTYRVHSLRCQRHTGCQGSPIAASSGHAPRGPQEPAGSPGTSDVSYQHQNTTGLKLTPPQQLGPAEAGASRSRDQRTIPSQGQVPRTWELRMAMPPAKHEWT